MKKVVISTVATLLVLFMFAQFGWLQIFGINRVSFPWDEKKQESKPKTTLSSYKDEDGVSYRVKAEGDYFYVYTDGEWKQTFWKGVNIGSGAPGLFPGELSIDYETYMRWFKYISEMNCNCIRVYTAMMPEFYNALYDFNVKSKNPLYLFHGVWMDEDDISVLADVYADNEKILTEFKKDALDMVSIIHGDAVLNKRAGYASGTYTSDVSPWFAGWILGMENDPKFILNTNENNGERDSYDGSYLYTQGSTPFEAFLATVGDAVIEKETKKYKFQSPLAFANWVTTDPLTHDAEPYEDEDLLTLNTESIKHRSAFHSGQFASYHVYPYYPDSMNYQSDYTNYIDENGKVNTYEAYLKDLKLAHTVPIVIAEFGVSTSRGYAHESLMGYNQGGMEETAAGNAIVDMFDSIYKQKYAGGIVFAWQDEWFKRTWNNVNFDVADRRPFWSNVQTCEQMFGIMAFEPGEKQNACYVDGDSSEWSKSDVIATTNQGTLSAKVDEAYVYFMLKTNNDFDFDNNTVYIPVDTIAKQGNTKMNSTKVSFDNAADFVISVNGKDNSRILCDAYYDVYYYLYGEQYKMITLNSNYQKKDSGIFNKMMMCTGYEMTIPTTKKVIPFASFETGKLKFGNSNPNSKDFNSLTDFCYKNGCLEIRIPWQLLNVSDPSEKQILSDFYSEQSITSKDIDSFKAGFGIVSNSDDAIKINVNGDIKYSGWTKPTSHERLKKSYYILKEALKKYDVDDED